MIISLEGWETRTIHVGFVSIFYKLIVTALEVRTPNSILGEIPAGSTDCVCLASQEILC